MSEHSRDMEDRREAGRVDYERGVPMRLQDLRLKRHKLAYRLGWLEAWWKDNAGEKW